MPFAYGARIDVRPDRAGRLAGAQKFGARLAQFVQGGDVQDANRDLRFQPRQQPACQRVVRDGVDQREDQRVVPAPDIGIVQYRRKALMDDAGGVLIDCGQEQCLFVREIRVGDGPPDGRITRDIGNGGRTEPVPAEADDRRLEDGPPRLRSFGFR